MELNMQFALNFWFLCVLIFLWCAWKFNWILGHECWDHVSVWSCWGRCDSREISDWKFPYKKSYHPVCVHAGRSKAVAMLRFCHPLADPETRRYEYMEANACHCQVSAHNHIKSNIVFFCLFCFWNFIHIYFFSLNFQTCSTSDTSCEAPNNFRDESSVKVLSMAGVNSDDLEY